MSYSAPFSNDRAVEDRRLEGPGMREGPQNRVIPGMKTFLVEKVTNLGYIYQQMEVVPCRYR